jgi:peptidoglycan-associated lipoprotein
MSVIGLALLVVVVGACQTPGTQSEDGSTSSSGPDSEFSDRSGDGVADTMISGRSGFDFGTIYFGFDKAVIEHDVRFILDSAGAQLSSSGRSIVIEGHCDEVGSDEYNLALGEVRAAAVQRYLFNLGVSADQMEIVSYGESRPALQGSGETVWRLNRRVEITSQR